MYEGVLVKNQTKIPITANAQSAPPMSRDLEDELFFLPLRERRDGDAWDDLRVIIGFYLCSIDISWVERVRKKRELSVLVARPAIGGFSHRLLELDGNAEAHAWICDKHIQLYILSEYNAEYIIYISTGIYRCFILDSNVNFARIPDSQESSVE